MPIIAPYRDDDGEEPRPCERAVLTSGTKCTAAIILRDENGKLIIFVPIPCRPTSERQSRLARKRGYRVGFNGGRLRLGVRWLVECVKKIPKASEQARLKSKVEWAGETCCSFVVQYSGADWVAHTVS